MPNDSPTFEPVVCKTCGSTLAVHLDRWDVDARHRQNYQCPVCTKFHEGTFKGRIVRVTRDLGDR